MVDCCVVFFGRPDTEIGEAVVTHNGSHFGNNNAMCPYFFKLTSCVSNFCPVCSMVFLTASPPSHSPFVWWHLLLLLLLLFLFDSAIQKWQQYRRNRRSEWLCVVLLYWASIHILMQSPSSVIMFCIPFSMTWLATVAAIPFSPLSFEFSWLLQTGWVGYVDLFA